MAPDLTPDAVNTFLAEHFPLAHRDGMRAESFGERTATARWTYNPQGLRPGGYIPGPTQFGLADCALWFATFTVLGIRPMAVTSELSIRYLRPALAGDLLAHATLISVGRRRLVGNVTLWVEGAPDRPVASAQGTYVDATAA